MTRINLPSNKPSTVDDLRVAIAALFQPGRRATGAELRAAIVELTQPEEPGIFEDLWCPETLWLSWFRPTLPLPPREDGTYCSPLDKAQITVPGDPNTGEGAGMMFHPPSIAHQGIKLLGAKEPQNDGYRISLVTRFIASRNGKDSLLDTHQSEAQLRLLDALVTWGRHLRENIATLPQHITIGSGSSTDIEAYEELARDSPDFHGGPLYVFPEEADREYIALLEKIGTNGKDAAAKLRKAPPVSQEEADTWAPWLPPAEGGFPARHTRLVLALWDDIVRPRLERSARKPPALARLVHAPVTQLLSGPKVREEGGQMALDLGLPQPCIIREVAGIPSASRGIELFKSIQAHRVLWHIVFAAHERAVSTPGWSPHLEYEGGYAALAEACGIAGGKGAAKVRELVDLFSVLDLTFPGYRGGLLTRTFIEAKGHRRALLKIVPGTPLLPGYVHELRRVAGNASVAARREQDLMPLLPVPPTVGRANDAGPQATLQLLVVAHFRDHAGDLAEGRGAPLPPDTWAQLAEEAHVPRVLAPRLLPHWQENHQDGPAVLKRVDRDRYTLGDAHAVARAFLENGGRRSLDNSENGRRSVAKRAAARRKVGQK
jgi:hypothetical protein